MGKISLLNMVNKKTVARMLEATRYAVALTGAGISSEYGSTFFTCGKKTKE